jgi:acyl-CoA synthetase (AMP-forming)/AMP-acid ligase II
VRQFLTLHHPATAGRYYAEGLWQADTLYALLARHAAERPQQWAARDGRRRLTWAELRDWVDGVAAHFRRRGLSGGDRVSVWLSNRLESVVTFLACSREGFACNPSLHRTYSCAEISRLLDRLRAKVLVTEPHWGADRDTVDLRALLAPISSLQDIYEMDDYPGAGQAQGAPATDPDHVVYLAFTSGTTGIPKCIMHSDNTLLANARDLVGDWRLGPQTRLLSLSPLSHHIGWVGVAQWLVAGCEFVPDDPPAGMSRLDWIIETQATYVMGVPTHAMDVLAEQQRRQLKRLGSVEIFYMAGAPIPPSVAERFVKQGIKPQNVYGMTENSSHQYTHPDDDTETLITTCGRGGRAYEVRLFDPADPDREVAAGEEGHIGGRGAALMLGYFGDQAATEASFNRDGWFLSGDLGILDNAGNLQIRGRLKDLIIRGGYNIYPAHIEALAMRHPEVKRAACFPVADERLGERVCLAVIGAVDADTLLHHLAAQGLPKHDMPEYFLRLEAFPVSASGKILQRQLAEMTKRGDLAPTPIRWGPKKDIT